MLLNALSILNVNSFSTACYVEAINSMHTINLFYLTKKTGFSLKTIVYEHVVSDSFLLSIVKLLLHFSLNTLHTYTCKIYLEHSWSFSPDAQHEVQLWLIWSLRILTLQSI